MHRIRNELGLFVQAVEEYSDDRVWAGRIGVMCAQDRLLSMSSTREVRNEHGILLPRDTGHEVAGRFEDFLLLISCGRYLEEQNKQKTHG